MFKNGRLMYNIAAHSFHKGCLNSDRNFPGAVCLFPNLPSGLTETLEIKSRWSPLYATFFDSEMPSLTSLQSRINSCFISCWGKTQRDLNMRYQNITKHRFKEEFMCSPPPPNVLPLLWSQEYVLSCPACRQTCFCSCLHQGHWEASRCRGSESLSACEGT